MKKIIWCLMCGVVLLQLTSCEKSKQSEELIGWWVDSSSPYYGYISDDGGISDQNYTFRGVTFYIPGNRINMCYHFIDNNTLESIMIIYSAKGKSAGWSTYNIGNETWYLPPNGTKKILTYVREGNKIFLANGGIFTIMDGQLYPEGGSSGYRKYK